MSAEAILIEFLSGELAASGIPVSGDVPSPRPERFVTVEKTGSSEKDRITKATLAVQSWAKTRAEADSLNEQVKALLRCAVGRKDIMRCHLETDYNYTDTTTNRARYQAVYNVVYWSA